MADVDVDRGQIVVVSAPILAVVFVGLALVRNSGIYAESLSSRETGSDTRSTPEERELTVEQTAGGVTTLSHDGGFESVNEYTIRLMVKDIQGRVRAETEDRTVDTT